MMHRALWLAGLLALVGCDDGGGEEPTPNPDGAVSMDGAVVVDRGVEPDGGPAPDGGPDAEPAADGGPESDAGPENDAGLEPDMAAGPDMMPPAPGDLFVGEFDGEADGWPAPWVVSGGVLSATIEDGMACLVPALSDYSLARMFAPIAADDAEVTFSVRFSDIANQGVGFYLHANGGYLRESDPRGAGYGVFVEGFRQAPGIGVWREIDGEEQDIRINFDPAFGFVDGVRYRVRFRVTRRDATTDLRARIWPEGEPEPIAWHVEARDDTPELQRAPLGIAVDSWNDFDPDDPGPAQRGPTCIDDVRIRPIANPLDGVGAAEPIAEGLQFTEGPLWDAPLERLLFTDIPANTIYALTPGEMPQPLVQPSGNANGLAFAPDGALLVCEHAGRLVRYADPGAAPEALASMFEGQPLHSPNDLAARSDGTIYFTDPPYGRGGQPGPLPFMGVFRLAPDGTLTAEHRGALAERPNGVALSPDERRVYVADTAGGNLHVWDVTPDGALADRRLIAENLPFADGMAVAPDGTLFVTTGRGVVALDGDGNEWGVIEVPRQPSNCTLAPDGTLYITAREAVYRVRTAAPGLRAR